MKPLTLRKKSMGAQALEYTGDNIDEIKEFLSDDGCVVNKFAGGKKLAISFKDGNLYMTPGMFAVKYQTHKGICTKEELDMTFDVVDLERYGVSLDAGWAMETMAESPEVAAVEAIGIYEAENKEFPCANGQVIARAVVSRDGENDERVQLFLAGGVEPKYRTLTDEEVEELLLKQDARQKQEG